MSTAKKGERPAHAAPGRGAKPSGSGKASDAVPGREYQGSGVMNKSGRYGSSKRPEDLRGDKDDKDDASRD